MAMNFSPAYATSATRLGSFWKNMDEYEKRSDCRLRSDVDMFQWYCCFAGLDRLEIYFWVLTANGPNLLPGKRHQPCRVPEEKFCWQQMNFFSGAGWMQAGSLLKSGFELFLFGSREQDIIQDKAVSRGIGM
jgi:hypothetical protein